MPRTLAPTIAGCAAVATLVLAAPNPATATVGSAAAHRVERDAGMVQQVRYWRRVHPYGYGYGHGYGYGYPSYGYYRPYVYYRPYAYYGGPYGYYGGPYAYYGRPGVSFSFGF